MFAKAPLILIGRGLIDFELEILQRFRGAKEKLQEEARARRGFF